MPRDPYQYFRVEAKEIVERLSRGVLELQPGHTAKEAVAQLLRLAHTLKGAAHVVKQAEIAQLAHQIEDGLLPYADGGTPVAAGCAEDLLRRVDGISARLAQLGAEQAASEERRQATRPLDEAFETLRIDIGEMDVLLEGVNETGVQVAGLKTKLAALEETASLASVLAEYVSPQAGAAPARAGAAAAKAKALIEDLHALSASAYRNLSAGVEQIQRELAQVRDVASQLRLVPTSVLFVPLQRAVHNAAEALVKQVEFETSGGEHRLDAHVLAAVRDALLHVVRNAVAHGIEPATARAAARKPPVGKVQLHIERRGNRVAFACRDDGRGFDVAALRRAAVGHGLIPLEEADVLSADEVIRLILRGGVSTTRTADEISGRGIGLDVVRETAARLKADLNVHTEPGRGTTIELCVPVSLLSFEAITVESGGIAASLPLDAVQQTLRLAAGEIVHSPGGDTLVFGGKTIPFLPLTRALRRPAPRPSAKPSVVSAVVVRSSGELAAFGVDRVVSSGAVVLRPIPAFAGVNAVVAGASLDSEGNPQLVLDPTALVSVAHAQSGVLEGAPLPPAPAVLVIDDSLTSRMLEQSILESAGFQVDLASSAEEALQKCRERRYNLFVVDIEMPGMNGFEFVEYTQRDSVLRDVPSVLVTSRNSQEDRQRGREAGARAYMAKSEFDQRNLLRTIRELVN
jgi:two-component system chemotaxis sensor kinase CheA